MIKPILTDKKVLALPCREVELPIGTGDKINIENLLDTANDLGIKKCAGLAAPQIGCVRRIIVVALLDRFEVMINPIILETKGKAVLGLEGCLSRPATIDKPIKVRRFYKIQIEYVNKFGEQVKKRFKNFEARVVQHEIDHLNGILIGVQK